MSQDQDQERTEQATPYKLEQAHKKGQTRKSLDVASLSSVAYLLVAMYGLGWTWWQQQAHALAQGLARAGVARLDGPGTWGLISSAMWQAVGSLAPFLFGAVVVAVVVGVVQTGFVWSFHPIKPDWSRVHPVQGFKRLWSAKLLFDTVKSLLKLTALALVVLSVVVALRPALWQWLSRSPKAFAPVWLELGAGLVAKLCLVLLVFALLDWVFARWDFARQMRMSHKELKDEHKHREGDPRIKHRQRELRLEFLKRTQGLSGVKDASVVLTNPSHVAVALRYVAGDMPAPLVVAKGAGELAAAIREQAYLHGVPVVRSPVLARTLYRQATVDRHVPPQSYGPVARILMWLQAQQLRASQGRMGA